MEQERQEENQKLTKKISPKKNHIPHHYRVGRGLLHVI